MSVASHAQPPVVKAVVTRECCAGRYHPFSEECQSLRCLERGPRRILSHDRAVQQRLPWVHGECRMHFAAVAPCHCTRVERRRRHHAQHLSRCRFYSHDAAYFPLHEPFSQCLKVDVYAQCEVLSRHGAAVERTVLIASLYAPVCIAQEYLHAFLSSELFFVRPFHALLAYIVARHVELILVNVLSRHFSHVAEDVRRVGICVSSHASSLYIEARKTVHLLLKYTELLVCKLAHEHLLRKLRVARIFSPVLYVVHALHEILPCYAESVAELRGVEPVLCLFHHHHYVVGMLVVDEQAPVAVGYYAACRELDLLQKSVTVGILLIVVAHYLERKQTYKIYDDDKHRHSSDNVFPVFKLVVLVHTRLDML